MRKLKLFLILSFCTFVTVPAFALNDTTLDNVVRLNGDGTRQGSAVRVLKLVRYTDNTEDGASIVSGDALVHSLISDDGVSVTLSTVSSDPAFCGIAAMTIQTSDRVTTTSAYDDVGGRNWGWMIVHGPANARIAAGSGPGDVAGRAFTTSGDDAAIGHIQSLTAVAGTDGQSVNNAVLSVTGSGGIFLDTGGASDTSIEVFVEKV